MWDVFHFVERLTTELYFFDLSTCSLQIRHNGLQTKEEPHQDLEYTFKMCPIFRLRHFSLIDINEVAKNEADYFNYAQFTFEYCLCVHHI